MRTTLYRMFSKAGILLYVGISGRWNTRLDDHRHTKPWHFRVAFIQLEHFPNRPDALAAEVSAIRRERPRYNLASSGLRVLKQRGPRTHPPPSDADIIRIYESGWVDLERSQPLEEALATRARSRARWERTYGPIPDSSQSDLLKIMEDEAK